MTETTARTRTTAPVIDYSALEAEEASVTVASNPAQGTPFPGWLRESYTSKKARRVTVPEHAVKQTQYLIRRAAELESLGVRMLAPVSVGKREHKGKQVEHFAITFQGKDKNRRLTDAERAAKKAEADRKRREREAKRAAKAKGASK